MRPNIVITVLVLAALAGGGFLLLGDSKRIQSERRTDSRPDETPVTAAEDPDAPPQEARLPVPDAAAANAEDPVATRPGQGNVEGPGHPLSHFGVTHQMEEWVPCFEEPDAELTRDCLQAKLAGREMLPEELAEIVCGEVPPDAADRFLIEEVASLWPPAEAPDRIRRFHGQCNTPGALWVGFLQLQSERDPEWLSAFTDALTPEEVFAGDDLVLLQALETLVGLGDAELREILEAGARGELGGSDKQVAYAVTQSAGLRSTAEERLDYLRSIATSPSFLGRPSEVEAVVRFVLEETPVLEGQGSLTFIEELFEDPLFAPGIARRILELYQWDRLPAWISEGERRALVARARDVLPSGS